MRKLTIILCIVGCISLIPQIVLGISTPYTGGIGGIKQPSIATPQVTCVVIDPSLMGDGPIVAMQKLTTALENYDDSSNIVGDAYEICFSFPTDPIVIDRPIVIPHHAPADPTKSIVIKRLQLEESQNFSAGSLPDSHLLQIKDHNTLVKLEELILQGAHDGLLAKNSQVAILNAEITGVGGGNCVELLNSNNSVIQASTISGCDVGIDITNSHNVLVGSFDEQHFASEKNVITNNSTYGIRIGSGSGIKFGYNENYGNNPAQPEFHNAVYIAEGENNGIFFPDLIASLVENVPYMLRCERNANNDVTQRIAEFDIQQGTAQIFGVDENTKQAKEFIGNCIIDSNGICDLTSLDASFAIDSKDCGREGYYVTAVYTHDASSALMEPVLFDEGGFISTGSSGIVQTTPSSEAQDETAVEDVNFEDASGMSGEGAAREVGLLSGGGVGGAGAGMKCSLTIPDEVNSTYAPDLGLWWIIFSILLISSIRLVKVRARNRNRRRKK